MELLRLRRRLLFARKGHKLLKDKLDGMIRQIFDIVKLQQQLSRQMEKEISRVFGKLILASAQTPSHTLEEISRLSKCRAEFDFSIQNIMGVKTPKYELKLSGDPITYHFSAAPAVLDQALIEFRKSMTELVLMAEYNKTITVLAAQIIEIKRRVNALEYVLIPELDEAVRFIRMKLAEMERSSTVSLLKIKNIVSSV